MATTVPLYAARVENLLFAPMVEVECLECGHKAELAVADIKAKLPEWERVLDIHCSVRCAKLRRQGPRHRRRAEGARLCALILPAKLPRPVHRARLC